MISYAQNHEDVLLARVFPGVTNGFYVDIGACDPVLHSVTKHFYELGWTGVNVEPGVAFEALAIDRSRDINLNVAVSGEAGTAEFLYADDPGSSELLTRGQSTSTQGRIGMVRTVTLNELLDRYARDRPIEFLKIDIEGSEEAVVKSTDWRRHRPIILLIEATYPQTNNPRHDSWEPTILEQGYRFAYFDGINRFYVREEDAHLLEHFRMPVHVLDGYTAYNPALEERVRKAEEDAATAAKWMWTLTEQLRAPGAPRALRMVLPAARAIRVAARIARRMGRGVLPC